MEIMNYQIGYHELELAFNEVAWYMGYPREEVPSTIDRIIMKSLEDADSYCNIQGGLIICDDIVADAEKKAVTVSDIELYLKGRLFNEIKGSEKIALFLCTAGPGISNISKRLMKEGELLAGYIFDVIGSLMVEKAMDRLQVRFNKAMKARGFKTTNRYSPGYCGWQTSEQLKLFRLFPEYFCGVRLTESALMDPIKSISGIIGVGHYVEYTEYHCELCDVVNCIYRNRKHKRLSQK